MKSGLQRALSHVTPESRLVYSLLCQYGQRNRIFTKLYADNYRCLLNFELPLEPLTVLMGPNGSGKSASLLLIAKLRDFILGRESTDDVFPSESLTRWDINGSNGRQTFELEVHLPQGDYIYHLDIHHDPMVGDALAFDETLSLNGKLLFKTRGDDTCLYSDQHIEGPHFIPDWHHSGLFRVPERKDNTKLIAFRKFIEATIVFALNPALVKAISANKRPVTIPAPDCSDFADWFAHLLSAEVVAERAAEVKIKEGALPSLIAFQATPSGDAKILECVMENKGGKPLRYRLDELSSGQIALVVLETALAVVEEHHGALLLDEPGNFLGLGEIEPLLTRLQDIALEGRAQIILSAHHPLAVDFLAAGHGCWLDREPSGPARVERLKLSADDLDENAHLRVSDLIARGWLSGLGVTDRSAKPQGKP